MSLEMPGGRGQRRSVIRSAVPTEMSAPDQGTARNGNGYRQQVLAFSPSNPSFAMIGTIVNAAIGSAHHHPNPALSTRPASKIAER